MKLTIAYITGRHDPKWEWFVDSLCAQTTPDQRADLEVLFIDGSLWHKTNAHVFSGSEVDPHATIFHDAKRIERLKKTIACRFLNSRHLPPKPCAWQGPFRQTKQDWFCAGNSRNTAFIVAAHDYVVFVDDLSVLGPQWFDQVRHAAEHAYVVCGAYKKVKQLKVASGRIESFEPFPPGVDSRWDHGSDAGCVPWHGSSMYGCSFGLPLEAALEVDGNDAACNGEGAEDYDFGIRLERAGWAFFYNRNMLTLESEEDHHTGQSLPRAAKSVTPGRLPPGYAKNPMSYHVMLNRVLDEKERILPTIGENLSAQRRHYQATGRVAIPREPQFDWRDGTPLSDL